MKNAGPFDKPCQIVGYLWITLWTMWTEQVFERVHISFQLYRQVPENVNELRPFLLQTLEYPATYAVYFGIMQRSPCG